jgi:hypothetical protein
LGCPALKLSHIGLEKDIILCLRGMSPARGWVIGETSQAIVLWTDISTGCGPRLVSQKTSFDNEELGTAARGLGDLSAAASISWIARAIVENGEFSM